MGEGGGGYSATSMFHKLQRTNVIVILVGFGIIWVNICFNNVADRPTSRYFVAKSRAKRDLVAPIPLLMKLIDKSH